jgi:hypothetical protein
MANNGQFLLGESRISNQNPAGTCFGKQRAVRIRARIRFSGRNSPGGSARFSSIALAELRVELRSGSLYPSHVSLRVRVAAFQERGFDRRSVPTLRRESNIHRGAEKSAKCGRLQPARRCLPGITTLMADASSELTLPFHPALQATQLPTVPKPNPVLSTSTTVPRVRMDNLFRLHCRHHSAPLR